MAGTKTGGLKAAQKNKENFGADFYARIGAIGGKNGHTGGFAYDDRGLLQRLLRKPTRAQLAGRKGGRLGKRTKQVA